ncbi:DUF3667 domain-containing protein [Bizionia myxarmorum]|uniref:DUF3667 domain-containing protein n=1 Tax=Bizionia myxarmorum TaxID=291186 RepID=A0A5D0RFA4_9FLAO|nr:DUF3667 domain-containing protein [Bizionia myxarmorum]TYB79455.1 DUF3667 domain-containing protein [Bizionia myxarmorum]
MTCRNCEKVLVETDDFCSNCGAKVIRNRLTTRNLFAHFSETFLNYDNKFLRTFIALFTKPEVVIDGYIQGVRVKYVNVISYFAISLTLVGLQLFIMNQFFKDALDFSSLNKDMSVNAKSPEDFIKMQTQIQDIVANYQSFIYILFVPITSFVTWLVFKITNNRTYNFTEHIVINLYYSAQVIIVMALSTIILMILGVDYYAITGILTVLSFIYLALLFKKLYKLNISETLLSILLFALFYGLILLLVIICGSFIVFITLLISDGNLNT